MVAADRTGGGGGAPAAVVFDGWGWRYPERERWAVRRIDLSIRPGERVAIVGPSGAGKSTLLRAVAGVLPDDETGPEVEGRVTVGGYSPADVRGQVGLVMQDPEAHTVMSRIGDDVAFGCENTGVPRAEIWERVRAALATVALDLPLDHDTSALSGGQRQRLALAGVLAMRPGVLVLDEPCANLDHDGIRQVHDAVAAALAESGTTMLVVEHRIGTWLDLVNRLIVLGADGGIVADGEPGEVLAKQGVQLAAAGVWVPGTVPARGSARAADPREKHGGLALIDTEGLSTARLRGTRVGTGIDMTVSAGQALAITGPNGVGKSTLGLTLAGLLRPEEGRLTATAALADGEGSEPFRWKSRVLAQRIGTVFQDPGHQFVAGSVRAEIAAGAHAVGLPDPDGVVTRLLDTFALTALADANPFTLSGGEQRRLAIAAVLATNPRIVVLDEPTSGQDLGTWRRIADALGALADAGTAIVIITHDDDLIRALAADTVLLGQAGAVKVDESAVPA